MASAVPVNRIFANVAELVNAPVLNTGGQKWLVGSNPTVSVLVTTRVLCMRFESSRQA